MVKLRRQMAPANGLLVRLLDNEFMNYVQKVMPSSLAQELFVQMTLNSLFAMQKELHHDALFLVAHHHRQKCTHALNTAEISPRYCANLAVKMYCNCLLKVVIT